MPLCPCAAWRYSSGLSRSTALSVLHQLDQKIIYPHYDFKHLTEKYFEIGMKLDDFLIQLVKYCSLHTREKAAPPKTYKKWEIVRKLHQADLLQQANQVVK